MGYFNVLFPFLSLAFLKSHFYNEKERNEEKKREGRYRGRERGKERERRGTSAVLPCFLALWWARPSQGAGSLDRLIGLNQSSM